MPRPSIFVRKTSVDGLIETQFEGKSSLEHYEGHIQDLALHTEASDLLARPEITRGNGETTTSIAWHVAQTGMLRNWSDLTQDERMSAGATIARQMDQLRTHAQDPKLAGWLQSCLNVPSLEDSIILIGDRPHLVNWGLLPVAIIDDPTALAQHQARTLGLFGQPNRDRNSASAHTSPVGGQAGMAQAAAATGIPAAAMAAAPSTIPTPIIPVLIATIIAAVILIVLLVPGILLYDSRLGSSLEASLRADANQALRQRIQDLQRDLSTRTCRAPSAELDRGDRRNGRTPLPPIELPAPNQQPGTPLAPGGLLGYLDRGAVLVLSATENNLIGNGTGFFINQKQLVTNRHVVENGTQTFVLSKALGQPVPARIVASTKGTDFGAADFAVLEVDTAGDRQILSLSSNVDRLQNVIAIGYPGYVMETDKNFQKLVSGDGTAAPQAAVTQGNVVALQTGQEGMELVAHTATIGPGNSGGPLVDSCGAVVGVNTFIVSHQENLLRLNFSLRTNGLQKFLDQKGIAYTRNDAACAAPVTSGRTEAQPPPPTVTTPPGTSGGAPGSVVR